MISYDVAREIAAQWQSSGAVGSVLASFASGAVVNRDELHDDIRATLRHESVTGYGELKLFHLRMYIIADIVELGDDEAALVGVEYEPNDAGRSVVEVAGVFDSWYSGWVFGGRLEAAPPYARAAWCMPGLTD